MPAAAVDGGRRRDALPAPHHPIAQEPSNVPLRTSQLRARLDGVDQLIRLLGHVRLDSLCAMTRDELCAGERMSTLEKPSEMIRVDVST